MRGCRLAILLVALVAAVCLTAGAGAVAPVGGDVRLTTIGTDADTSTGLTEALHGIAFNSRRNEYLVTFASDDTGTDNDFEVFGQRVSAAGTPIGQEFRISNADAAGRTSTTSAVAYSRKRNEYLVVFETDQLVDNDREIYGQRLSGTGAQLGGDFRISNFGDVAANRSAAISSVAVDPDRGSYLVTWYGEGLALAGKDEVFAQLVSGAGVPQGADVRISNTGPDGDAGRDARWPGVAFGEKRDEWLVVFASDGRLADKQEIFGQRVSPQGAPRGSDFLIAGVGGDDVNRTSDFPAVAYGSHRDRFLVVFEADGLATDDDREIFGQTVTGAGAPGSGPPARLSFVEPPGPDRDARIPAVAYSPTGREFQVTWHADALATNNENEAFGQRVGATGRPLDGNVRLSQTGTDGDPTRETLFTEVAADTSRSRFLAIWSADGLATPNEFEVFGHLLTAPKCAGRPATLTGTAGRDKLKGTKKQDVIAGLGGRDTIKGLGGGDFICGGGGKDTLLGGKQKDTLAGGGGRDRCVGGPSRDRGRSCERRASL